MQYKKLQTAYKEVNNDGTIKAIVSVFGNVDLAGETVVYGAFTKSLQKKLPKGVWMHDWNKSIAITVSAKELEAGDPLLPESLKQYGGLLIEGKFNLELTPAGTPANPDAYRAWSDLKFGAIDEFSIGYEVLNSDVKDGVRLLTEMELFEWSPVLVGANRETALLGIKSLGFNEHITAAGAAVKDALNRVIERAQVREQKAGRTFSQANHTALSEFAEAVIDAGKKIKELLQTATEKEMPELGEVTKSEQLAIARIKILQLKQQGIIK